MAIVIQDLLDILEEISPFGLAESWDNVGLLVGSPSTAVQGILVALDPEPHLPDQAQAAGANVIITHHPIIFHPLKGVRTDHPDGTFLSAVLGRNIQVIACHTNLDSASGGVSAVLADLFDLDETSPLVPAAGQDPSLGLGRIGRCRTPLTPDQCIERLRDGLDPPFLLEAGPRPENVRTIALCGGSGSDLARTAWERGADLYLCGEIKHDIACWARDQGAWLIDGGHFATEQAAILPFCRRLGHELDQRQATIPVIPAEQTPPLTLIR